MNYVKSCLIITMLLGIGYSQCNESNWQEYYPDMPFCDLARAECYGVFFVEADLEGTIFDGANLLYAYFDENEDTYYDVSYDADAESGDSNLDGVNDVLDAVMLIDMILNS